MIYLFCDSKMIKIGLLIYSLCIFVAICETKNARKSRKFNVGQYTTDLINNLLPENYNRNIRPNDEGEPMIVNVSIYINDIGAISETAMEYKVDFHIDHYWNDYRLTFPVKHNVSSVTLTEDFVKKIWIPDTTFDNAKDVNFHKTVFAGATTMFKLKSNGDIFYATRISGITQCPMDLTFFPLDEQMCSIEVSSYGYTPDELIYHWAQGENAVQINPRIDLPTFRLLGYSKLEKIVFFTVGNTSSLQCDFFLARSIGYYVSQVYIPAFLIVVISWVPFWLDRNDHHARVALGVTTVLTMTTLITSSRSDFPKISYLKAIDVYLFKSFMMVFLSLIEYATVGYFDSSSKTKIQNSSENSSKIRNIYTIGNSKNVELVQIQTPKMSFQKNSNNNDPELGNRKIELDTSEIDMKARWLFPCCFLAFNLVYIVGLYFLVTIAGEEQNIQVRL